MLGRVGGVAAEGRRNKKCFKAKPSGIISGLSCLTGNPLMTPQTVHFSQVSPRQNRLSGDAAFVAAKRQELALREADLNRREAELKAHPDYERWQEDDLLFAQCENWDMVKQVRRTIPSQQITDWAKTK